MAWTNEVIAWTLVKVLSSKTKLRLNFGYLRLRGRVRIWTLSTWRMKWEIEPSSQPRYQTLEVWCKKCLGSTSGAREVWNANWMQPRVEKVRHNCEMSEKWKLGLPHHPFHEICRTQILNSQVVLALPSIIIHVYSSYPTTIKIQFNSFQKHFQMSSDCTSHAIFRLISTGGSNNTWSKM